MEKNQERRRYPRLNVYHLVKYRLSSAPKEKPAVLAYLKDIGGGGGRLRLDEELPVSTVVQLYINFPQAPHPITALAKIAWIKKTIFKKNKYEAGLQFLEIDESSQKQIASRVDSVVASGDENTKRGEG